MMLLLLLCACGAAKDSAQIPVSFRTSLISAGGCGYTLDLTADYGEYLREYRLSCDCPVMGETSFTVLFPEEVSGITATVGGDSASVAYEDTILAVEQFSTRRLSPMAAPYLLAKAWSEGYISSWGADGDLLAVCYTLGYGNRQIEVRTWFSGEIPVRAEISDGINTMISCGITELTLQKKANADGQNFETDMGGGGS